MEVIIILGSPNSDEGRLYSVGIQRCETALILYKDNHDRKILATGGFGRRFNKSSKPHAQLIKEYLMNCGVDENNFLDLAESTNTIEDATMSKAILDQQYVDHISIVTSDFHIARASFIFKEIFKNTQVHFSFHAAPSNEYDPDLDLQALKRHEVRALDKLKQHGIDNYYNEKMDTFS